MEAEWTVIVLDRSTGEDVEQLMTPNILSPDTGYLELPASSFNPTASDKPKASKMALKFPISVGLNIREGQEVWAGYREPDTRVWTSVWFGGYIGKSTRQTYAGEVIFSCELDDYSFLTKKTNIVQWPTPLDLESLPILPPTGYPPDYSVAAWLAGTTDQGFPYDGLIPYHFNLINLAGIQGIFNDLIISEDVIPYNAGAVGDIGAIGAWGIVSIDDVIKAVVNTAHIIDPTVLPSYWFTAVIGEDPTTIVPQLRLIDQLMLEEPQFVFAVNPTGDEWPIEHPFTHERDFRGVSTRVDVKGVGTDLTAIDPATGEPYLPGLGPLNYWSEYNEEHAAHYQTKYQKRPGWAAPPIQDNRLDTLAKCRKIAEHLEQFSWGAIGTLSWVTEAPVEEGMVVGLRAPQDGYPDTTYFVALEVNITLKDGTPKRTVQVGQRQLTTQDILSAGTTEIPILERDTARGAAHAAMFGLGASSFLPGVPRNSQVGLVRGPMHSQHNEVIAFTRTAPGITFHPPLTQATDDPLSPAGHQVRNLDADRIERGWSDDQGVPRPHAYKTSFARDGYVLFQFHEPVDFVSEERSFASFNAGVTLTYTYFAPGADPTSDGVIVASPTAYLPLHGARDSTLRVDAVGVDPTVGMGLTLHERKDTPV
jgi:hypothetical protein